MTTQEILTLKLLRTSFDTYCCDLETKLADSNRDIAKVQGTFKLLEKLNDEFEEESNKLIHKMISESKSEDSIAKIMKDSHEATIKFSSLAFTVDKVLSEHTFDKTSTVSSKRNKLNLPKIDFRKFSGDIKDWLQFWSLFKRIHDDDEMEDDDKFQYLLQTTVPNSKARQLIESYPPTGENYSKAIESLKSRFGRDDLLVEYYVRELLKLVLNNLTNKTNLTSLYDKMESQLRALDTLGVTTDTCSAMLYPLLESCIPEEVLRTWQRSPQFSTNDPLKKRLENFMVFLKREVENEERISLATSFEPKHRRKETVNQNIPSAAGLLNQNPRCTFCKQQHVSSKCTEASKMTFIERKKKLLENGCCYRCLRHGHLAKKCTMYFKLKCEKCGGKHQSLMCSSGEETNSNSSKTVSPENPQSNSDSNLISLIDMSNQTFTHVFLQTLLVNIVTQDQTRRIRALIDTGSQKSYILRKTAINMKLEVLREEEMVHALFGGYQTETVNHVCYKIRVSSLDGQYYGTFETFDQPVICGNIIGAYNGPWSKEIENAGVSINDTEEGPIELLFGADVAGQLYTGRRHVLSCGLVLMETKLGWTIMGRVPTDSFNPKSSCMFVSSMLVSDKMICDLWNLELLGINDPVKECTRREAEKAAMAHFSSTVKRNDESRYEVNLPWIENHPLLPTNFYIAKKRLDSLIRKLKKDGYFEEYNEVFIDWLEEGIIEEASKENYQYRGHYLPHRHVVKPNSVTTKLRPVFDASAKENSETSSLNQCLEKGMNFIELIPSILLRFRQHRYGVISDIRKAFLQISLNENDRDFLRFLWYTPDGELKIYRHTRVVFGLTCSPFLLGAVIQHHLKDTLMEDSRYSQEFLNNLSSSFYVDNSIISLDHREEIVLFRENAQNAMMEAQMDLRCWEYTEEKNSYLPEASLTSVLGLRWNKLTDTLEVSLDGFKNSLITDKLTKKMLLSTVSKIFDVIGFTSPALLIPKILLQKTCKLKIPWNSEVPDNIKAKFFAWYEEVQYLANVKISRWIRPNVRRECKHESLHVFCDASQEAYAIVIFIRVESVDSIQLKFVQSKNRVAPIKSISIPRLELLAATVGARILTSVKKEFDSDISVYCWTDSTTVLSWIKRKEIWKPFVRNRVLEIQQLTDKETWYHVPGIMNPADLPSRGCLPKKLWESEWWKGPSWLLEPKEKWPIQKYDVDEEVVLEEKQKGVTSLVNQEKINISWLYHRFSHFKEILDMVSWMRRFISNCKVPAEKRNLSGILSVEEIAESEKIVIKLIQQECFENYQDTFKNLMYFQDEIGILRIRTKISEREDTQSFRYPIILPAKHVIVSRLIFDTHISLLHSGVQTVLNSLREKYWILGGKKTVRSIISKCVVCRKQHSKSFQTPPVQLPRDRVRDASVFEVTGVDAAGPLFARDKGKIWVLIFTCAIYRAVHFEVITSMSTECFLLALRRFIARRGRPSTIYSDNGRNFVGAQNAFSVLDWTEINRKSTAERINWKFNPPTAAWWGGWWERLIGILKQLVRKILGKAALTYEELVTIICDCEAVVNQRPLTSLSENPEEWESLTPAMFLQEIREVGVPDLDQVEANYLRRRYKYRLRLRNELRRRFRNEYLGNLALKSRKKYKEKCIPKVGDLGLIEMENCKRLEWPLARIMEVFPGKDGSIRLLRLRVSSGGQVLRPIQRFYPLEVHEQHEVESMKKMLLTKSVPTANKEEEPHLPAEEHSSSHYSIPDEEKNVKKTRCGRTVKPPQRLNL